MYLRNRSNSNLNVGPNLISLFKIIILKNTISGSCLNFNSYKQFCNVFMTFFNYKVPSNSRFLAILPILRYGFHFDRLDNGFAQCGTIERSARFIFSWVWSLRIV